VNRIATTLFAVFVTASIRAAAPVVLYDTGWEAAPASPAWALGTISPQNGWTAAPSPLAHLVVSNGSAGATVSGQAVQTPYGTQFHKFVCSTNTSIDIFGFAWADISGPVAALDPAHTIKVSMDLFVPSSQSNTPALYGFVAFHGNSAAPWGMLIDPSDQSVNFLIDENVSSTFVTKAFAFDTWFHVETTADYTSGQISVDVNGTNLPSMTMTSTEIGLDVLTDVDLGAWNYVPSAPTPRIAFSDNFRVTAETASPGPTLTIAPDPAGGWTLSWSAAFADWEVQAAPAPDGPWATEPTDPPVVANGVASVNVSEPPNVFYRLHKP